MTNNLKKWGGALLTLFGVYGGIWTILESSGITPDKYPLVPLFLIISSTVTTSIYLLVYEVIKQTKQNKVLLHDNARLTIELAESKKYTSHCCVINQSVPKCPVGIKSIHSEMKKTIETSLTEAKKTFQWLGLSAFNVVHNNKNIFAEKRQVSYEFTLSNPNNKNLPIMNDNWFGDSRGRMNSEELITNSDNILKKLKLNANDKIEIRYVNQIPSFRIMIVDDKKVYVSFYEPLVDALKTTQLEIVEDDDIQNNIFKWFKWYYEKTLLNEELTKKTFAENNNSRHEQE